LLSPRSVEDCLGLEKVRAVVLLHPSELTMSSGPMAVLDLLPAVLSMGIADHWKNGSWDCTGTVMESVMELHFHQRPWRLRL